MDTVGKMLHFFFSSLTQKASPSCKEWIAKWLKEIVSGSYDVLHSLSLEYGIVFVDAETNNASAMKSLKEKLSSSDGTPRGTSGNLSPICGISFITFGST